MAPRGRSVTLGIDIVAQDKGASKVIAGQRREVAGLGDELQRTAALAGGGFAVYQGFDKLEQAAKAASSLNETQNTAKKVFGESSDAVLGFAEDADKAFGQSERASLQAMNGYGSLLNNMGLAREESARWSTTLASLGSDLAAAWDTTVPDALAAIQSGLAGQTEPLQRFGIFTQQANLEQDALALGLDKNITKLSRQERALVLLTSIMRQSKDQQGQFTREIGGLAAQTAIATAEAENAEAAYGQGLIPIFTKLQQLIGGVASAYSSLPGPLQEATSYATAGGLAIGGVVVAAGLLGPALAAGKVQLVGLGVAAKTTGMSLIVPTAATTGLGAAQATTTTTTVGMTAALRAQVGTLGLVKTGLLGAAAGYTAFSLTQNALEGMASSDAAPSKLAEDLGLLADGSIGTNAAVRELGGGVEDLAKKFKIAYDNSSLLDRLSPAGESPVAIRRAQNDIEALDSALASMVEGGNAEGARKAFGQIAAGLLDQGVAIEDVAAFFDKYHDAQGRATEGAYQAAGATDTNTEAIKREASAVETATKAQQDRVNAQKQMWAAEDASRAALADRLEAQAEVQEAERAATGDSREYRDALRSTKDAQESLADSHRGVAEATEDLNDARKEAAERLEDLRDKVEDLRLSEKRADLDRRQAEADARTALADPRLTGLEKEDAALKAQEAAVEQFRTTQERLDAERELATSTVENDEAVVSAKERVIEAEERVKDAAESVTEAQRRQGEVIAEAKERGRAATQRYEKALEREAEAWGELVTLQFGATAGVQAHIDKLRELEATLDPNSPLAQNLAALRGDLEAITLGGLVVGGQMSLAAAEAQIPGGGRGTNGVVNITNINQGTSQQVNRQTNDTITNALDKFAGWTR